MNKQFLKEICFEDRVIETKVKDILRFTNLLVAFSKDRIMLQTEDGKEGCIVEHYYDINDNRSDPREAIISSFYIVNNVPSKLFKELENKLYFKFIKC